MVSAALGRIMLLCTAPIEQDKTQTEAVWFEIETLKFCMYSKPKPRSTWASTSSDQTDVYSADDADIRTMITVHFDFTL